MIVYLKILRSIISENEIDVSKALENYYSNYIRGKRSYDIDDFDLSFINDLSLEDLQTTSKASSNLKKQAGNYEDFYFNYGLDYDLRDSTYRPSSGSKTAFYQTLPLVSTNNEIKNTLVLTQYKK